MPPATKGDFAFVEHMVASMESDTGRVAVVMPQGVLFRSGAEKEIRQRMLEAGLFDAVIGLPPNLFYNTRLPACVLILRAKPLRGRENRVLFVGRIEAVREARRPQRDGARGRGSDRARR